MNWLNGIWDFFHDELNQKAVASILAVLGVAGGLWTWWRGGSGKEKGAPAQTGTATAGSGIATGQVVGSQTIHQGAPVGHVTLSLDEYEVRQERLRDRVQAEFERSHGDERARLQAQLDEVNRRLAEPEAALRAAEGRIAELEALIGNAESDEEQAAKGALERGDFGAAREMFERLEARTATEVRKNADAHFALGKIAEEEVRWADAARHYGRAAELHPTSETLGKADMFAWRAGHYDRALDFGRRRVALATDEAVPPERRAGALNDLAITLRAIGEYAEAEPLSREASEITRKALGERHPTYATRLNNRASLLVATGRYAEAEPLYRAALEIAREGLGEGHPDYAACVGNLAGLLQDTGRYAEAEPLFREALEIRRKAFGGGHPDDAISLNNLALLLQATGRHAEAEPLYREALEIDRKTLGEGHPEYAGRLNNLALLLQNTGRHAEAEPLFREALEIKRKALGEGHPDYALSLNNLAVLWAEQRRWDEALPMMERALAIYEAALGAEHPDTRTAHASLDGMRAAAGASTGGSGGVAPRP